tara:strand:- start:925 stop:1176 length:252 start_codon:yes stop_codon:yes gene_type:complete
MGLEAVIEIDTSDFRDDNDFVDVVGDIAIDVIRDSGEVESIVRDILESDIRDYMHDAVDPDNEHFINAVAKALHNMARSYVGA